MKPCMIAGCVHSTPTSVQPLCIPPPPPFPRVPHLCLPSPSQPEPLGHGAGPGVHRISDEVLLQGADVPLVSHHPPHAEEGGGRTRPGGREVLSPGSQQQPISPPLAYIGHIPPHISSIPLYPLPTRLSSHVYGRPSAPSLPPPYPPPPLTCAWAPSAPGPSRSTAPTGGSSLPRELPEPGDIYMEGPLLLSLL